LSSAPRVGSKSMVSCGDPGAAPLAPLAPALGCEGLDAASPIADELRWTLSLATAAPPLRRAPAERRVVGGGGGGGGLGGATALSVAPKASAPLAQRRVGGVPITKTRPNDRAAIADIVRLHREVKRESLSIARAERQHSAAHGLVSKHRDKDRDTSWAKLRIRQTRIVAQLFRQQGYNGGHAPAHELIDESAYGLVMHLCNLAAFQAARELGSRRLQTASAAFWAIVLVQEAWCRSMNGDKWEVPTKERREALCFDALETVYDLSKGDKHVSIEHHEDETKAYRARSGVTRRICSHSLGNKKEKLAKIECLDALLKRDGDRGLHPHILKMWQPLVVRLPKPVTLGVQGAARQIALASHSAHGTGPA